MHPIERLRMVARSQSAPAEVLVEESATALSAFSNDPAGMVSACRRIVDRHPTCGPLWWLAARILTAPESMAEAYAAAEQMSADPTAALLAGSMADGASVAVVGWPEQTFRAFRRRGDVGVTVIDSDGESEEAVRQLLRLEIDASSAAARNTSSVVEVADLVLVEVFAAGTEEALVPAGSKAAALLARSSGVPVWAVAGVGRLMPERMFQALNDRWELRFDPLDAAEELFPLELADKVACDVGVVGVSDALATTDCPIAPELFRPPS
ncbi:MAG TPA: hypothetical protein VL068_02135 [Microthrixaceae bacterium]|nr:hypothetical protein [Microthrixaceae bacterium]